MATSPCQVSVVTEPAGASVRIPGGSPRLTPVSLVSPCGLLTLTIDHPRYLRVEKTLRLAAGSQAIVTERLERPGTVLTLRSTPPGATFRVNGNPVGRAPAKAPVDGFTFVNITASLDGYAPHRERYYVRGTDVDLNIDLAPVAAPTRSARAPRRRRPPAPDL